MSKSPSKVAYHPVKFGVHRNSDIVSRYGGFSFSRNLAILKRGVDFTSRSPSRQVTILPTLVASGSEVDI